MDVRNKEQSPNLALALVIDKSGSMGKCHCNNPDALPGQYVAVESGQPKVDIAKEAIMRAAAALGPRDYLGVVAFDTSAHWAVEVSPLIDVVRLERSIGFAADGQTNMRSGVEAAYEALQEIEARHKHVILMTDGWVREGELTPLATEMQDNGITLSVVAAGSGSARYLEALAESSGGRYYPAANILRVPDFFLKETIQVVGQYIIEEPFYPLPAMPSPVLRNLDTTTLPLLLGYNGSTPKGTARVLLSTPRGDPLLATWQYGLGRSAAWTSDLKGQWADDWVTWDDFARFAAQLVGWTLPAPRVEGVEAAVRLEEDGEVTISVEAADQAGHPLNFVQVSAVVIGSDLEAQDVDLAQVGAGEYRARMALTTPGTYLVRVAVNDGDETLGQQTLGLVVPYSPEYAAPAAGSIDRGLLERLARLTGGGELPGPVAAFVHNLPAAERAREVWQTLLLLVALLFPVDVAVRRVMLGRREVAKVWDWVHARLPARRVPLPRQERVLGHLFRAQERVRGRTARTTQAAPVAPQPEVEETAGESKAPTPPQAEGEDALARLRQAKQRVRNRERKGR
jgi:hypothetical protein